MITKATCDQGIKSCDLTKQKWCMVLVIVKHCLKLTCCSPGFILCIGWAHTQNDHWFLKKCDSYSESHFSQINFYVELILKTLLWKMHRWDLIYDGFQKYCLYMYCCGPLFTLVFMMMSTYGNIFRITANGNHWSPVNSHYKCQWRRALMFSVMYAWKSGSANNWDASDLRCHGAYCDITVMLWYMCHLGDWNFWKEIGQIFLAEFYLPSSFKPWVTNW